MDWTVPIIILQLIFLESILSVDNAAVLGTMVTALPKDQPVPWPKGLIKFGTRIGKLLGTQRKAALRVGLLGAYLGRGLMIFAASLIIQNPWIKLIGAAYLIYLAFENLGIMPPEESETSVDMAKKQSFWSIVLKVEIMDLAFSLDNVVAAVSLSNKLWVVLTGVGIGILFMRFAATWFSILVDKEPSLKVSAYLLVMNIGIELIVEHFTTIVIPDWIKLLISVGTILISMIYRRWKFLHFLRPILAWLARGAGRVNGLIHWIFEPIRGFFHIIKWLYKKIFSTVKEFPST